MADSVGAGLSDRVRGGVRLLVAVPADPADNFSPTETGGRREDVRTGRVRPSCCCPDCLEWRRVAAGVLPAAPLCFACLGWPHLVRTLMVNSDDSHHRIASVTTNVKTEKKMQLGVKPMARIPTFHATNPLRNRCTTNRNPREVLLFVESLCEIASEATQ